MEPMLTMAGMASNTDTTIGCKTATKERLGKLFKGRENWDEFLNRVADEMEVAA